MSMYTWHGLKTRLFKSLRITLLYCSVVHSLKRANIFYIFDVKSEQIGVRIILAKVKFLEIK